MSYDPAWDMPQINWQQQGSFQTGSIPPTTEPTAGTQVWLGPIAREWVPWVCGALDGLRNPSSWIVADDTHMYDTLRRVDTLLGLLCGAGSEFPIMIRLTSTCELQTSSDGGTTWTTVPGWDANIHGCIVNNLPPALPPNPGSDPSVQLACNVAGFLSAELIQHTMSLIYTLVQEERNVDFIVNGILAGIGVFFPEIDGATIALNQFVNAVIAQALSEINTVATDPVLWSAVTCAIFNAIKADGHLTVSNILTAGANILGISYPGHAWAPPALAAYWLGLGAANLLWAQSSGALTDVDCSGCGAWCVEFDFRTGLHGWTIQGGNGVQGATGIVGTNTSGVHTGVSIEFIGAAFTCVGMDMWIQSDHGWTGPAVGRSFRYANPSTFLRETDLPTGIYSAVTELSDSGFSLGGITELALAWFDDTLVAANLIQRARVHGIGPIPNGWVQNCV